MKGLIRPLRAFEALKILKRSSFYSKRVIRITPSLPPPPRGGMMVIPFLNLQKTTEWPLKDNFEGFLEVVLMFLKAF